MQYRSRSPVYRERPPPRPDYSDYLRSLAAPAYPAYPPGPPPRYYDPGPPPAPPHYYYQDRSYDRSVEEFLRRTASDRPRERRYRDN